MLESRSSEATNYLRIVRLLPIVVSFLLVTFDGPYLPWSPRRTGEQEPPKSPSLSPESYTVVGDDDVGASEPPQDPPFEGSQKGDHKRMLGISIKLRERYRRSIMPQGHDQVIGGGESSIDPEAQVPLQTRRKGSLGGGVRRRLKNFGKRSTA